MFNDTIAKDDHCYAYVNTTHSPVDYDHNDGNWSVWTGDEWREDPHMHVAHMYGDGTGWWTRTYRFYIQDEFPRGLRGAVVDTDEQGNALIRFDGMAPRWILRSHLSNLQEDHVYYNNCNTCDAIALIGFSNERLNVVLYRTGEELSGHPTWQDAEHRNHHEGGAAAWWCRGRWTVAAGESARAWEPRSWQQDGPWSKRGWHFQEDSTCSPPSGWHGAVAVNRKGGPLCEPAGEWESVVADTGSGSVERVREPGASASCLPWWQALRTEIVCVAVAAATAFATAAAWYVTHGRSAKTKTA